MKKIIYILFFSIALVIGSSVPAFALTLIYNNVKNTSQGAIGVEGKPSIYNRHPGADYYLVLLEKPDESAGFAWEIAEKYEGRGFYLLAHLRYPVGSPGYEKYGPNGYIQWSSAVSAATPTWHDLKITNNGTSSNYWDVYLDGVLKIDNLWWPYPTGNLAITQLEAWEDTNPYFFMGRHDNIHLRGANGNWWLQDSGWADRIQTYSDNSYYIYWYFNDNYWDWEVRTAARGY